MTENELKDLIEIYQRKVTFHKNKAKTINFILLLLKNKLLNRENHE